MIGEQNIPGYSIGEVLHEGNHTIVYQGIKTADDTRVILKTPAKSYPTPNEIATITKEFDTLVNLDIDGVNKAIELLNFNNRPVIVLQDFNGIPLADYIQSKKLSLIKFLEIAIKITEILGRVHARNIMHKDINPHNILINKETEEVRIIDFGICAMLSVERTSALNPNVLEGTLKYMSPEQTGRMNRSLDYRTDLYSLGMTFYEMLVGQLPFNSDDAMELVHCHIAKAITPPVEISPRIPKVLSDIILKLVSKIAEDRYQSATGLKHDLELCMASLGEKNIIPSFKLGQKDVYSRFRIPERLYGREKEIAALMNAFGEVEAGKCRLMLISGASGIGKTATINEIHKPTARKRGYFISGKCDQFKRNIPFNVFSLAFAEIVKYLVSEPQNTLMTVKNDLFTALGLNVPVLLELIPEFELITGKQNKAQELNPLEAQNRFFFTIREFIKVFATKEHPLSVFLDDLQWADDASLALIKDLITKDIPYLFIIGTYRDSEVSEGHPLIMTLNEIRKTKPVEELTLAPLDERSVNIIVADTLQVSMQNTKELAGIIFKRTAGNPFYINELLKTLYKDGFICFDHDKGTWSWDIGKVSRVNISGNVVDILTHRLKELSPDCLLLLQTAACIGNTFDLKTLAISSDKTAAGITEILWPAIEQDIVLPLTDDYRLVINNEDFGVSYKFHHDRIQQAAYQLIEDSKRKEIHVKIGRLLRNALTPDEQKEQVINLVRHFNEGIDLLTDVTEKNEIAELNLLAGKKAQSAVAYLAAFTYFRAGIELLPGDYWQAKYALAFDLHKGFAQNAYQANDIVTAERAIDLLLSKAHTNLAKVDIIAIKLRQYTTVGKTEEAILAGIDGLKLLGYKLSPNPGTATVLKEVLRAKWNLGKRKPGELINMPEMSDPEKRAAARLLTEIGPSAYITGNDNLYGLTQLKVVNLSLLYGNCPESSFAYVSFGAVLGDAFGDYKSAESFGKLALEINEKLGDIEYRCRVIAAYGVLTHHFNHHWTTTRDWFKKGVEAGYLSGDQFFLGYCASNCTVWDPRLDLATSITEQRKYLNIVADTGYADAFDQASMYLQLTKNRRGLLENRLSLSDDEFNETERLDKMVKRKFLSGLGFYYLNKATIFLFYEEYEKALEAVKEAEKYVKSMFSLAHITVLCTISYFTCSGYISYGQAPPVADLKKRMKRSYGKMKKWANYNPENFQHLLYLMDAEKAGMEKDSANASRLYELAISTANKNEWQADEAFANELAAKYYNKNSSEKAAAGYFREANFLYDSWGATGKTKFLEEKYPKLFKTARTGTATTVRKPGTTIGSLMGAESMQVLDVATIVKSSQAISGEIELESLLSKMMQIIIMNAGAENGTLLLDNNGALFIQAVADNDVITTMQNIPLTNSHDLPKTIINYVYNLNEAVVLKDAHKDGKFSNDEYIVKHDLKSVLCSPIVFLNKIYGVIYLENNVSVGAFTQDRLKVLQLLSSQMAISINNANLYANLEEKVGERTTELRLEKQKSDELLYNILPEEVAEELKQFGAAKAKHFDAVTVLFTDFRNFSDATDKFTPQKLLDEINIFYSEFDRIITKYGLEKIKTIGDSYMCAGGLPVENKTHARDIINAAIEIRDFTLDRKAKREARNEMTMEIRIGAHTGPVVAGIVGVKKFAYDIWGNTVNLASRMESSGEVGKINISGSTYELIKNEFECEYRGKVTAKNRGEVDMYFVHGKISR